MADEVSPEIIQGTQKLLGRHVTKPQLTDKLLKKPPFRFLHDVIVVLVRNGFLKGLYTDAELNSENVKDRDSKIAFLNKLITAVKTLSGKDLQTKPNKIIAGLDATETNRLLQTIAKLIDDKVDTKAYVNNLKKSSKEAQKPANNIESPNTKKTNSKTSITKKSDKTDSSVKKTERKPSIKNKNEVSPKGKEVATPKTKSNPSKPQQAASKSSVAAKDGKSKDSKGAKTSTKSNSIEKISPKGETKVATPKTTSVSPKEKERTENEETVKQELEEIVEDIPVPKIDDQNVADNLSQQSPPRELNLNIENEDKPPSYQQTELNKNSNDFSKDLVKKDQNDEEIKNSPKVRQISARPKSARPRSGNNEQIIKENKEIKLEAQEKPTAPINIPNESQITNSSNKANYFQREPSAIAKKSETLNKINEIEEKQQPIGTPFRPKSSMLRPPSVRPSSARPGAPRLRPESSIPMKEVIPLGKINVIIENFDAKEKEQEDEEETVVIQSIQDETSVENNFVEQNLNLDIPSDKGHLVAQILEQIQDGEQGDKAPLEWEHKGFKSRDASIKEITALRASIQDLTKIANPLGKLASYLHEDVEAMHSELQSWINTNKLYVADIAKQKRANNEGNQPLLQQLQNLEESIKHERHEIASIKYNICRNDDRIRQLISKQIAIDK